MPKKREKPMSVEGNSEESSSATFPTRDYVNLYCQTTTLQCALTNCVPCGYKIGLFDVALDKDFTQFIPNQRPELCPRLKELEPAVDGTMGFRCGMKVLTVGDGDFSYSVAVARIVNTKPESQQRVIATSYESKATLQTCYSHFSEMVDELKTRNVTIAYEVDATNIEATLLSKIKEKKLPKFDRIIWNFPCTAIGGGRDGQNDAMEENKELVRKFVRNARHLLTSNGEIHMCHKSRPPYNQWHLDEVVLEACKDNQCLTYHGRVVFDRATLPPYTPRKALNKKSFPYNDAVTYIFGMSTADSTSTIQPPAEKDSTNLSVGVHKQMIVPVDLVTLNKVRRALQVFSSGSKKRSNKGVNKGSNQGVNKVANQGVNKGSNQGVNKGANQGVNKGSNQGSNQGSNKGTNKGSNQGANKRTNKAANNGPNKKQKRF